MLTPRWEVDVPELSAAAAGVEDRMGSRGVARNGISFPRAGVRKVDSLSDDLQGSTTSQPKTFTGELRVRRKQVMGQRHQSLLI